MSSGTLTARPTPVVPIGTGRAFSADGARVTTWVIDALEGLRTSRTAGAGLHDRRRALNDLVHECSTPDWDGYGAEPINPLSVQWAERLLDTLPAHAPTPELSGDPSGDVLLEWCSDRGDMLTVSVGRAGEVRFALRAPGAKLTGIEAFEDDLPSGLALALATLAR